MSIETDGRRQVEHQVTARLSDGDMFDAENDGWGQARGKPFQVNTVSWPSSWRAKIGAMTPDSDVALSGYLYRKDGSLGMRRGTGRMKVRDLPEPVRDAMLAKAAEVYAP